MSVAWAPTARCATRWSTRVTSGSLWVPPMGPGAVTQCNDGVIRRVQPDVQILLDTIAELDLPPLDSLSPQDARAFIEQTKTERPPGPDVGEIVDGTFPGAEGELDYRLYRPPTPGPHPVVVYFHGGGWVLGSPDGDDPMCRDLCVRSDSVIVSCDYRHAPEHRFPAAPHDAFAALEWVAGNLDALGGRPGPLAVCGWSAGGNLAAVVCQMARDTGGPEISQQVLITPVTDADFSRASYRDNAEGFVLTTSLMEWFWNHYAEPADRTNPLASPLQGDLSNLPPALVVTAELDPLRDEGAAYAQALEAAGNEVRHMSLRGHMHTSLSLVDILISAVQPRVEIAEALRSSAAVVATST